MPERAQNDPEDERSGAQPPMCDPGTATEPEGSEQATGQDEAPDVYLDVPALKVDEIGLEVENLHAHVSLQAEVLDLVKLHVGVDATLGHVALDIKGVEAQAQLKARLDNVATILDRVLTTIDRNPEILQHVSRGVEAAAREVSKGAGEAAEHVGRGAGEAVEDVGEGGGQAVRAAGETVEEVGRGAGEAVEEVGEGGGRAGRAAGEAVEEDGRGVDDTAEEVGESTDREARGVGGHLGRTTEGVKPAGNRPDRGSARGRVDPKRAGRQQERGRRRAPRKMPPTSNRSRRRGRNP